MKCMGDFGQAPRMTSDKSLRIKNKKKKIVIPSIKPKKPMVAKKPVKPNVKKIANLDRQIKEKEKQLARLKQMRQLENYRLQNREPAMIKPSVKTPANLFIEKKGDFENEIDCCYSDDIMINDKKSAIKVSKPKIKVQAPLLNMMMPSSPQPINKILPSVNPVKKPSIKKPGFFSKLFNVKPKKTVKLKKIKISKEAAKKILKAKKVKKTAGMSGNYCMGDF